MSWRGREFTADELKKFDLQNILGAPCILSVVHNEKGKAKVESVIKLTKGTEVPEAVNKPYSFWLDEFERGKFDELSDGIKAIIEKSPEYQSMMKATTQALTETLPPSHAFSNFEDDIPFAHHGMNGAGVSWRAM